MVVPMLDDQEYAEAFTLYKQGFKTAGNREQKFKDLLDYYYGVTGFKETEPNAIMHHQISQYGPECENCGKPYRTDKAAFCAACGNNRK